MKSYSKYIVLLLLLIRNHLSFSQDNFNFENVFLQNLSVEDGLSQSNANCMLIDSDGFVWIGTDYGLNRFDGYDFKSYLRMHDDSLGKGVNAILSIYEDSQQNIWVGTDGEGLFQFDRQTDTFTRFLGDAADTSSISLNTIICITEDSNGYLWLGTYWGLNRYDRKTGTFRRFFFSDIESPSANTAYALHSFEDKILVGTSQGFSIGNIESLEFEHYTTDNSAIAGGVYAIYKDRESRIWLGYDSGIGIFELTSGKFRHFKLEGAVEKAGAAFINVIHEDEHGNVLIGTGNAGLWVFNEDNDFINLSSRNLPEIANLSVYSIAESNEKIWIGTFGKGVFLYNKEGTRFTHLFDFHPAIKNFAKNSILELAEDQDGNIWIGTDGAGLYKMDPDHKVIEAFIHDPHDPATISSNVVKSLLFDRAGNLYAGTYLNGMDIINTSTGEITHYKAHEGAENSLSGNNIWTLEEDDNGHIWIGTLNNSVNRFIPETGQFIHYQDDIFDTTKYLSVTTLKIIRDSKNILWFVTPDGICRYIPGSDSFARYESIGKLTSGVTNIFESGDGTIWVAAIKGLFKYAPEKDRFDLVEMKTSDYPKIQGILEDEKGKLWFSTYEGIAQYDPESGYLKSYDESDGLQGKEFNYDASLKASNGKYYFGGLNGLNVFEPRKIKDDTTGPEVVLTGFSLFHQQILPHDPTDLLSGDINYQEGITLDYDQKVFTIAYAGLDFDFPKQTVYAYRLDGFDKKWNFVGKDRSATYTNLSPGSYTFEVKAQNKDGYWSENLKSIKISVRTPYWQTAWFRAIVIVLFIALCYLLFLWRTRTLKIKSATLERHVEDRTRELQETLDKLRDTKDQLVIKEKMASIGILSAGISHELNNPLNFISGGLNIIKREFYDKTGFNPEKIKDKKKGDNNLLFQEALRLIDEGFKRSSMVVKSMISLYNKDKPVMIKTDITEMIEFVLKKLENELDPSITLEKDLQLDPIYVLPDRLQQGIINIIENAIYETMSDKNPHQRFIKITTEKITDGKKNGAKITITNTGSLIPKDILPKIFDPFFTAKEVGVGSGLGLSVAYSFIEQQGGTIEVNNNSNGVTFTISLPYRTALSEEVNIEEQGNGSIQKPVDPL